MVTTVAATWASSTTTSATKAAATVAVAATPTSTRTDQKPIRKSNRIKTATSASQ
jgi:hypothetical protein